jgi:Zn-dependent peptidase ImmA (M78 family)
MRILGRQILSAEEIESRAETLLLHLDANILKYVKPTPLIELTSYLTEKHGIIFRFDENLGFSEKGERLLGAFNPKKRVILVDASLKADEHKFNFTLAHELGHLSLHRNIKMTPNGKEDAPTDTINERIGSTNAIRSEADWLEWQANYYASALLMPREIFKAGLIMQQKQMGISRVGSIFVDHQPSNQSDFFQLLTRLSQYFKVSKTAVEIRLLKLNLVDDRRGGQSIRSLLDSLNF